MSLNITHLTSFQGDLVTYWKELKVKGLEGPKKTEDSNSIKPLVMCHSKALSPVVFHLCFQK